MTRAQLEQLARGAVKELAPVLQEYVFRRALGRPVVVWSLLSSDEFSRVYGACRRAAILTDPPDDGTFQGMVSELLER